MKWSASLLDSSFGFTVLDVGVDPFIFMISRQICVDFISASLLHHMSHCCFLREKSWQKSSSLFRTVGLALKVLMNWLTCFSIFFTSGGRKERVD